MDGMGNMAVLETHPNNDYLTIHVRRKLTDEVLVMYYSSNWRKDIASADRLENGEMADDFFAISGIIKVDIGPFKISLEKARLFSWKEMEGQINEVLKKHKFDL